MADPPTSLTLEDIFKARMESLAVPMKPRWRIWVFTANPDREAAPLEDLRREKEVGAAAAIGESFWVEREGLEGRERRVPGKRRSEWTYSISF